ncbi:hypothetical protein GT037_007878 [Alternaria burnsii]|uniref:DRBM domain-containing protein n=5 Tax=Alternaria sect. Alternaria TaxID=2499237 RepID=A0A177DMD1_ALTAL|nr:hypothetical protein CC77DRAFT_1060802 [Alternaria alternata]XP_028502877.1 hypothetical protein AA0111_g9510 [Alternaria arborescens]XP_038784426.1 uncharacterized protein GT037_007878 [Alternaria burnsii]XP_051588429.1 uncharacterized protein J4E82_005433 [Alternaria postmessia]KAB2100711.1 hypothetical protein AG0111_0g10908 [Alternaria gaisen]RII10566.1 hypothetical protein CUC08_Gglean006561 [Alternaria sp. MG1]RYN24788.1 hypothetical protein AA0115_g7950 [Alternaria tenuissima]KAF76
MAAPESYVQKLQHYCATNQIAQPQFQDYSDPRGIRTAWSSSVFINGREYRAHLWRDYRYLEQSREEAAEVAWKALSSAPPPTNAAQRTQFAGTYTTSR